MIWKQSHKLGEQLIAFRESCVTFVDVSQNFYLLD